MTEPAPAARDEWKAHWPTVMSGMMGMSFYAMITYHFGLFIQPLEKEFHWARADISLGLAIYTGTAVVLGPVIGALIDRMGSRRIGIFGLTVTSLAIAALGYANGSLSQWYMLWCAIAVTAVFVKSTVWGVATSSLFTTSRSLALSVVLSGSAIAQFASPLLGAWLIGSFGWRSAYHWFGLGWGGLSLVLVLLFFIDARDVGKRSGVAAPLTSSLGGLTIPEALRSSQILRIAIGNLLMSSLGGGVAVHMVPILSGKGMSVAGAAGIAALAGITGLVGKLLTGWLMDRYQGNFIPVFSFALQAVGYFFLLNTFDTTASLVLGVMVLGYTGGAGLQVTTYLCSRYAGLRNFGKIYATIASMMMLGTSIGPWIAGSIYDHTHSYDALLLVAIPVMLLSAAMFFGLGPYPKFHASSDPEAAPAT